MLKTWSWMSVTCSVVTTCSDNRGKHLQDLLFWKLVFLCACLNICVSVTLTVWGLSLILYCSPLVDFTVSLLLLCKNKEENLFWLSVPRSGLAEGQRGSVYRKKQTFMSHLLDLKQLEQPFSSFNEFIEMTVATWYYYNIVWVTLQL